MRIKIAPPSVESALDIGSGQRVLVALLLVAGRASTCHGSSPEQETAALGPVSAAGVVVWERVSGYLMSALAAGLGMLRSNVFIQNPTLAARNR
jgi:hypothetical protein